MLVILPTAAILGYAVGMFLLALLGVAALRRRLWPLSATLWALEVLFLVASVTRFSQLALSPGPGVTAVILSQTGHYATIAVVTLVLFNCLRWASGGRKAAATLAIAGGIAAALMPRPSLLLAACGAASAMLCVKAAARRMSQPEQRFFRLFGIGLAVPAVVSVFWPDAGHVALAYLPAVAALFRQTLFENVFGLLIPRHLLFMIVLGLLSATYLTLIRLLANTLAFAYDAFGSVIEATLILAAAILWLPFIVWMTRVLERRTALYPEFGKRVIEEAVTILDPESRAKFLANGIRQIFHLKSVVITLVGYRGSLDGPAAPPAEVTALAENLLISSGQDCVHRLDSTSSWAEVFRMVGYNYVFALRYQTRLIAVMWIDSTPREYIDEGEPVLRDLCRQMSHSLEACRLMEEKVRLERSLAAQEHLAALGNVAAAIAHEVKNPLSSIRALAQFMSEDSGFAAKYGRDLSYVMAETDRLNASVRQLLEFARPAQEPPADVDFSNLVSCIVDALKRERAGSDVHLNASITPGLTIHQAGNHSLRQIVWNLLLNAVQATGGSGHVEVLAEASDERHIRLSVQDDGPGVPEGLREKIFQPYFTTGQKGTGLGLYIVKKNVQDLAGSIEVLSPASQGKGARFSVVLPAEGGRPAA